MMLDKSKAIRKEKSLYIFICSNCSNEIKSKEYYLNKHSGLCRSCCVKKRPFEHLYNKLLNTAKFDYHEIDITYKDFIKFTEIKKCHYCYVVINWQPYNYKNSQYKQGSYFLDRKNNDLGYLLNNCVVCCTKCNRGKGNRYTHDEWYGMTEYFRRKTLHER